MDLLELLGWALAWLFSLSMAGYLSFCVLVGVGGIPVGLWKLSQGKPDPVFGTKNVGEFLFLYLFWLGCMAGLLYIIFG